MKKLKDLIYILLIIFIIIAVVPKKFQNDTFFELASGKLILEEGISGEERLVWHEGLQTTNARWLFDILITLIYNNFGFVGIYLMVLLVSIIQGILFYYVLYKITNKKDFSFLITILSMYTLKVAFTGRAQIFSNLILLIEFYCLENIKNEDKFKKGYVVILSVLPILFANIHASTFPMYLVVFMPYIAEYILYYIPFIKDDERFVFETKNIKLLLILFAVAVLEGFCVPVNANPYTDMFKTFGSFSTTFISEMQQISIFDNIYVSGMFLVVVLFFTMALLGFTKTKMRVSDGLFILGFGLMSLNTTRAVYWFILISGICFSRVFCDFLACYDLDFGRIPVTTRRTAIIMLMIVVVINSIILFCKNFSEEFIAYDFVPVKAAQYIKDNLDLDNMKLYNHFNFGSYLEFCGIKTFIDSRAEVFIEEFNPGTKILKDWNYTNRLNVNYNETFDKYGITHVLLYTYEPLTDFIRYDSKWNCIYQDTDFVLYERAKV